MLAGVLALLWLPGEAWASCSPQAANNVTATCTGTTTNQGNGVPGTSTGANGYGSGAQNPLTVTVMSGATVTGNNNGIFFSNGTVFNFGTISGTSIDGINATNNAVVTNTGTILGNIGGIVALNGTATVTNSGFISGTGANGDGIAAPTGNAIVTNSGNISGNSNGIVALNNATVTNSGIISGGVFGRGIDAVSGTATVTNSGIIMGGSYGIYSGTTANVSNSGSISGGTGIFIVSGSGTAIVTNSGTIIGTGGTALQFRAGADTLGLLPGSRIVGAINLGGGGDTVNFRVGNQNLTFDTLVGATVTSTVPFAVSGNRVATIDPTPFANANTTLMDFSRAISSAVPVFDGQTTAIGGSGAMAFAAPDAPSRFDAPFAGIPGLSAYAPDAAVFKSPTVQYADGTTVWARDFAGQRVQQADGVLLRTLDQFYGGMIGGDWQARPDLRLGAFLGAGETRSTLDLNFGNSDSNLVFGGLYGHYLWGASFLNLMVQGGGLRTDTTRGNINNNLAPGGLETATASYNGWYVSPEATWGHNVALGSLAGASYTLTPSVNLRYLYASFDGYTESGTTAPLTVGTRGVQDLEERGQLKLMRTQVFAPTAMIMANIYGGVLGVQRAGSTTVGAILLGQAIPFATPGKNDVWGGFGGAGLELRAGRVTLFASGEYLVLSDSSSIVSGRSGIRVAW
jgi:hypothetical protein